MSSKKMSARSAMAGRARDLRPAVGSPPFAGFMRLELASEMYSAVGRLTLGADVAARIATEIRFLKNAPKIVRLLAEIQNR
jgi:hypothetical protein